MILNKETLPGLIAGINDYSGQNTSYSPFYSNIALEIHPDEPGIGKLWLHYNRFSRVLWNRFADFSLGFNAELSTPWKLVFGNENKYLKLAFYAPDCFGIESTEPVRLFLDADKMLLESWNEIINGINVIKGYSRNGDARDPDASVPFALAYKTEKGTVDGYCVYPVDGMVKMYFAFEALEFSDESITAKISAAPGTVDECGEASLEMITDCVKDLDMECSDAAGEIISKAIHGLIFNLAKAPGKLKEHISAYPSRGYSSHFLWDSCFQNLAYEKMSVQLAKEFLLQFAACQRADGKYEQFLCSTWGRPHFTQPALVGWAALRIAEKDGDENFRRIMLESIEKNNRWWLCNRMTGYGLISCPDGLETGQDDSPRFDKGDTLACDMNSYLLNQINCTVRLAEMLGETSKAMLWKNEAKKLSDKMTELLYCAEDNIFYDVLLSDLSPVKIVSPVSFLPFWAGITFPEVLMRSSIEKYLLSPEYLFGKIPFPSVAYNEPEYVSDGWWRGPTWMPEAWLMLETLDKTGYSAEKNEAAKRLYDMLVEDYEMHELFDSATGKGLGCLEQGWTCAIFAQLCDELHKEKII